MENQLKKLIELGVKELTVKDGYATAVNPYPEYILSPNGNVASQHYAKFEEHRQPKWQIKRFDSSDWQDATYEQVKQVEINGFKDTHTRQVLHLPPIPTNLPDGKVSIRDVEEVERVVNKGSDIIHASDYKRVKVLRLKQPDEVKPIESIEEGFFYDEDYYNDIVSYAEQLDEEIEDLPDDWSIKVNEAELQPIVVFTPDWIVDNIHEERYSENMAEEEYKRIVKALKANVDFEKLNALIPRLLYSTKKTYLINKADLLEAIK